MDEIGELIAELIRSARDNPITVYGRRTEAMFGYVAASLGACQAIKQEDAGEIFLPSGVEMYVPDYRLLLEDGSQVLVEVKNRHGSDPNDEFHVRRTDFDGLVKYAKLFQVPLRLAIYWSSWRIWTLVTPDDLDLSDDRATVRFLDAMRYNHMASLGDFHLATTPPVRFRMVADPSKPRQFEASGEVTFTIGEVQMFAGEVEVTDPAERQLLLYMMFHGTWTEAETSAGVEGGELQYTELVLTPMESNPEQGFDMMGAMSSMISDQYNDLTTRDGTVRSLTPSVDPSALGQRRPGRVSEMTLPLWVFIIQPAGKV